MRDYLAALQTQERKRGKQRTLKSVTSQLAAVEERLTGDAVDPVDRVLLTQELLNLQAERSAMEETRLESLESRFVAVAKSFSDRNGLTWDAWRAADVPPAVLRRAGIEQRNHNS